MELFEMKEDEINEAPFRNINSNVDCQHSLYGFRLASDADVTMSGRILSDVAENNASCDERPSDDCAADFDLVGGREEVTFGPDYVSYCGKHYMNPRFKIGIITLSFILKDPVEDDGHHSLSASGIHGLAFPAADVDWYEKLEAIESLDEKYRALWSVTLDTGTDQQGLPEQGDALLIRTFFPNFDGPLEEVIYPQGDPDAVSISKRDVDVLFPDTFLNDTL